jgi:hypothetical protein
MFSKIALFILLIFTINFSNNDNCKKLNEIDSLINFNLTYMSNILYTYRTIETCDYIDSILNRERIIVDFFIDQKHKLEHLCNENTK